MDTTHLLSRRKILIGIGGAFGGYVMNTAMAAETADALTPGQKEPTFQSGIVVKVKDLGAVGDGAHDDTDAFQKAIDQLQSTGGEILIDPGSYKISKTLNWINPKNTRASGIWFIGAGYPSTRILSFVQDGPLLKIRGVPLKGPINTTFFWGGGIEGIDFVGSSGAKENHDALDVIGWYYGRIRNCRFSSFSRNGITGRVDLEINSNPDFTSSELRVEDSTFERLGGRGYYGALIGNPAWIWSRCIFDFCAQGAALILSAGHTFDTCSFGGSGYLSEDIVSPGDHAHLEIGQLKGSIARINIGSCEFDFAKTAHIFINSLAIGYFHDNRFIYRKWSTESVVPKMSVVFAQAGAAAAAQQLSFERNIFRVDGTGGDVTLYIWANVANVQNISISGSVISDESRGKVQIKRYVGYDRENMNTRQNYSISDDAGGWISKGKWPAPGDPAK